MNDFFDSLLSDPFFIKMLKVEAPKEETNEEPKENSYFMVEEKEYKNGDLVTSYKRVRKVKDGKVIEDTLEREPKSIKKLLDDVVADKVGDKADEEIRKSTTTAKPCECESICKDSSPNKKEQEYLETIKALELKLAESERREKELKATLKEVLEKEKKDKEQNFEEQMKKSIDFYEYFTKWLREKNPADSFFTCLRNPEEKKSKEERRKKQKEKIISLINDLL